MLDNPLVLLAAKILLPVVPAILLFWLVPSTATVETPGKSGSGLFGGLKLQLTGAFAGYIVVSLLVWRYGPNSPNWQIWKVKGRVQFFYSGASAAI